MELLHHHPNDGGHYPNCKRCKLNEAAPEMLDLLQTLAAYFYEYRNGELSGYEHELAGQVSALLTKIT
jgi:hypothetical protein